MTEIHALPLADPSDMVEMHRVFRNALAGAPGLVGSAPAGESDRVDLVGTYYENVLCLLRVHHDGEDALMTPRLLERNPDSVELINAIATQHTEVLDLIGETQTRLAEWQRTPDDATASDLLDVLGRLDGELGSHLDAEEEQILPLAARSIDVMEWGELPAHGLRSFDGDKLWLVLGLIRDEFSASNLAEMDAHLPPPIASMWADSGETLFRQFVSQLRI